MTVSDVNEPSFTEKFVLRALIISLLIHFLAFFTYKIGQSQGWWANMAMPRWMQVVSRALIPAIPNKIVAATPTPMPLMFVEVDPANAVREPPKAPKFYGANSTVAANPNITKLSTVPDIRGRQDKVLKTTEDGKLKAQPLQPTPPPRPQTTATAAAQKQTYTPGDLASARPAETARDGKPEAETAIATQPQPVYQRPRTIAEALARNGTLGEKALQAGGVNNVQMSSSLDVKSSAIGAYDQQFVEAVKARWDQLWENRTANASGKVVLEFRLHPDGRITGMTNVQNEVSDFMENMCERAILDPEPFQPWPREMRLDIPADYRDIQFTFFYDLQ
ncbi:MAG TPA: hypothetical protein VMR33_11590 [Candidatus Baltobacteraceae bacterium]|nr:hypothetical protein [Candidatus Baltobacteraceae bacterium]